MVRKDKVRETSYNKRDIHEEIKDQNRKGIMRIISIGFIAMLMLLLYSCTAYDYYTLSSPDKSKCITLEYSTSLIPGDSQFVKLYLGVPPVDEARYVKMLWSDIGGVAIDWNASPLKIRSWLIKESTFSKEMADVELKLTDKENVEFHEKGSSWKSYDFTWVSSGQYRDCER